MNLAPSYEFGATTPSDRHIVGWCRNTTDRQPVEVLFKSGGKTLFSVTASQEVDVQGSNDEPCGFDVIVDADFWIVYSQLDVCTPAGDMIASLERSLVRVKKRSDIAGPEHPQMEHKFDHPSPLKISGRLHYRGDAASYHYVKLFSRGELEAHLTPTPGPTKEADDEADSEFCYRFDAVKGRPILDRLVFVVVDDRFAFLTKAHTPSFLKHDESNYVLPLPIDLNDVVGTQTLGADTPQQVLLYGMKQFLGWGWGTVLVFDRQIDVKVAISLADGSSVRVAHTNGNLGIAQHSPKVLKDA
ncbi:hypothetical protein IHQ71_17355 [Rhizobium sp. TH2]|uniref:hypothetical protein n=1 Tax=Rhizobium sp. TH2 TaxID=2775403 RepID=UPI0021586CFA|nr:hypothetical protein [Rhizobium sp. TH2]UVC06995.1 hypothetical protein IHQ71_17355 [Rhizobium sp. TH2]